MLMASCSKDENIEYWDGEFCALCGDYESLTTFYYNYEVVFPDGSVESDFKEVCGIGGDKPQINVASGNSFMLQKGESKDFKIKSVTTNGNYLEYSLEDMKIGDNKKILDMTVTKLSRDAFKFEIDNFENNATKYTINIDVKPYGVVPCYHNEFKEINALNSRDLRLSVKKSY